MATSHQLIIYSVVLYLLFSELIHTYSQALKNVFYLSRYPHSVECSLSHCTVTWFNSVIYMVSPFSHYSLHLTILVILNKNLFHIGQLLLVNKSYNFVLDLSSVNIISFLKISTSIFMVLNLPYLLPLCTFPLSVLVLVILLLQKCIYLLQSTISYFSIGIYFPLVFTFQLYNYLIPSF
jgi:hypothetical protein